MVSDQKIYVDRKGEVWIISGEVPIHHYNAAMDSLVPVNNIPQSKSMIEDELGNLYFGTFGDGIYVVDAQKKDTTQILEKNSFPKQINRFAEFQNEIFAATWDGILKIDRDHRVKSLSKPEGVDSLFNAIAAHRNHGIWVGTMEQGLYTLETKTERFEKFKGFDFQPFPDDLYIVDLKFDSQDRLWVSVLGDGIYLINFRYKTVNHLQKERFNQNTLLDDAVSMVYEDRNKSIWVATYKGISLYDPFLYNFNRLTQSEVPNDIIMTAINEIDFDKKGNLWLATSGSGIIMRDALTREISSFNNNNSPVQNDVITSMRWIGDKLWASNQSGKIEIFSYLNRKLQLEKRIDLNSPFIYAIFVDSEETVWLLLGNRGLIAFDGNNEILDLGYREDDDNTLSSNRVFDIKEGPNKIMWISTSKGLCSYDLKTSKLTRHTVDSKYFLKLEPDPDGTIWIWEHLVGLKKYDPISKKTELLYSIPPEFTATSFTLYDEWFWMGTSQGIVQLNKNTGELIQHNHNTALQSLEFTSANFLDRENGVIYLGGHQGLNWFRPENIVPNPYPPETVINSLEMNDKVINNLDNPTFDYEQNSLSLRASSLHYSLPDKNNFKYRLLDFEDEWTYNENNSLIRYPNLPPGDYQLEVLSSNYDGVWDTTPATFNFAISPPWYKSNVAYLAYFFITILIIYIIYRYFKSRWELQSRLRLEHQESERLKDLDNLKNRLYTNISHEFRTPLTLISGPVERQLSQENLKPKIKDELNLVKKSANRLLILVDQLLDLAKLESGNLKISVLKYDLAPLVKQIASPFKILAEEKDITMTINVASFGKGWVDADVLEKILSNLLSNAIKYTPKAGEIIFNAALQDNYLLLTVINNGVKFSKEEVPKLFQRYYQSNRASTGAGIGLSLVKELCVVSHGSVIANLIEKDEIQFTATLPISKSAYQDSEIGEKSVLNQIEDISTTVNKTLQSEKGQSKKPILLIVEDDTDIRKFIKSIFVENYQVKQAVNGKEGLSLAKSHLPDIIISDIMMPDMDGIQLTKKIKSDEITSHIPILLLTAKSGNTNEVSGLKSGADDYITKPFNVESLLLKVKNLLEHREKLRKKYGTGFQLKDIPYTNLDEQFLLRLHKILNECITQPDLTSESLSNKMNVSRTQLHRKLKALSGKSTTEFIRQERTKLAKDLLENSDLSISEIAYKTGFNSPSYFVSSFKKDYNKPPSSFRN